MKKTIIASTVLATLSFGSFAQSVNVEEANIQTQLLVDAQMAQIDARILEQLENQDARVVMIDDTVYEKDSQGVWTVVGTTSVALAAGLLSGSSSNSKNSSTDGSINLPEMSPSNPVYNQPANPLEATPEADNGRSIEKIAENAWTVSTHGELDGYIIHENGEFTIRNADGDYVGSWKPTIGHPIQGTPANPIEATPEADNGRSVEKIAENAWAVSTHDELDGYIILENGEFTIRNADGDYVGSWKPTIGHPIQGTPVNPIEATPEADNGRSVEKIADNAWAVSTHGELDGYIIHENGEFTIRNADGDYVGSWKPTIGHPIQGTPANPIEATPEADNGRSVEKIAENAWTVSTHDELDGYIILENGEFTIRNADGDYVGSWKPTIGHPIQGTPVNPIEATPEADNGRSVEKIAENAWAVSTHGELDGYIIHENGEFTIRNADGDYVGSWKPTIGHPIQGTPVNPIEATPEADNGRSVEKIAENAWAVSTHGELDGYIILENGEFTIRNADGDYVGSWKPTIGHPIQGTPVNPIEATPEADNGRSVEKIADNAWAVSTHGELDGYVIVENGGVTVRDSDMNEVGSWSPKGSEFSAADVRNKFASLSQSQRNNIRQMLRNRK
ncbi:hypothetical protein [Vibrio comitans]|uniref:hypothetical protein n=2 Tax=Vibrio comitans TaxID=413401 RepID=UPI00308191CA